MASFSPQGLSEILSNGLVILFWAHRGYATKDVREQVWRWKWLHGYWAVTFSFLFSFQIPNTESGGRRISWL